VVSDRRAEQKRQRELALNIQGELIRVGCLKGRADGIWGRQSRAALSDFLSVQDETLATDALSDETLAMVRGVEEAVCVRTAAVPSEPQAEEGNEAVVAPARPVKRKTKAKQTVRKAVKPYRKTRPATQKRTRRKTGLGGFSAPHLSCNAMCSNRTGYDFNQCVIRNRSRGVCS